MRTDFVGGTPPLRYGRGCRTPIWADTGVCPYAPSAETPTLRTE
ncbi:MAG: hypothetical protein NZ843_06020 [Fimbriimonadales bacterium]|nr:hypothetical protein [Fimbriimonadales bacterium]